MALKYPNDNKKDLHTYLCWLNENGGLKIIQNGMKIKS